MDALMMIPVDRWEIKIVKWTCNLYKGLYKGININVQKLIDSNCFNY